MRSSYRTRFVGLLLTLGLVANGIGAVVAQTVAPAPYVKVFIDGQLVSLDVPPAIAAGRVLVPLRGVFNRLGAVVTWDPATQMVLAARGDTSISLRIGDTQASINGQPTLMDVPALLVDGRTMVPLRFISQALGAQVSWDATSTTVQIASAPASGPTAPVLPPSQTYPPTVAQPPTPTVPPPQTYPPTTAQPPVPSSNAVTGTVVGVRAEASAGQIGQIQVLVDKAVQSYRVVTTTAISRVNVADNTGGSEALSAILPGDRVQMTVDRDGIAQSIRATYRGVSGRIIAITDAGVVVLENGDTYRLNPSARVMRDGKAVEAGALRPGDVVQLRLNPETNEIWAAVIRQEAAASNPGLASVAVTPSGRELRAGDVVEVVATGAPGGRATFSIGGLRTGVPMVESTAERGTYYGSYTVQPGDVVRDAEVTVRLVASNSEVFTATATTHLQIRAGVPAPPIAPTIISPAEGATIGTPFRVTGRARPGARVKVTADYDGSVLLFQLTGTLGTQVVTADQSGNWSATFSESPPVYGIKVIITAVEVGVDGQAVTPAAKVTTTIR
ncbi:MAG TPA: stalk domain-containing protein [bacterium]|nr:stalk domain-containing protein [bacterium]